MLFIKQDWLIPISYHVYLVYILYINENDNMSNKTMSKLIDRMGDDLLFMMYKCKSIRVNQYVLINMCTQSYMTLFHYLYIISSS